MTIKGALQDLALKVCTVLFHQTSGKPRPVDLDPRHVMEWIDLESPAEVNEVLDCALEMGWLREMPEGFALSASGIYVIKRRLGLMT